MPIHLPHELTDSIIGFVRDERDDDPRGPSTLLACALVCRDWVPASMHHLFRQIFLCGKVKYDRFVHGVLHSDALRCHLRSTVSLFIGVNGPYDAFHPCLVRDANGPYYGPQARERTSRRDPCRLFLCNFARHLPNLESLLLNLIQ
ncbi:hypothetical protein C8Q74DRAFT_219987 [Fomes fomentarius]|nr:hypothetical protein C8Q74DRAFT_219987 [Fomes fomentarius]